MGDPPGVQDRGPAPADAVHPDTPSAVLPDPEAPVSPGELPAFDLLRSLPLDALADFARSLRPVRHRDGDRILVQGERAPGMHLLREGKVRVEAATEGDVVVPLATLGPGEGFGEMSLLTGEPASASVIAEGECVTLALDRAAFNDLSLRHPQLLRDFTAIVSRRLRVLDEAFAASRAKERDVTRFLQEDSSGPIPVLVGKEKTTRDLDRRVAQLAASPDPVLLLGERGTGKELLARRIHASGPRAALPLLSVDGDRITETQWGDSLFGDYHRKDGRLHPRGVCYMDLAEGGTLLLKNVESLPPAVLERLARYLDREGAGGVRRRDVRILATHSGSPGGGGAGTGVPRNLPPALAANTVSIPPLRERKRDIPELARHFLEKHGKRLGIPGRRLDDDALGKLVTHDYRHGNVRELEEAIRRALVLSEGEVIGAGEVFLLRPGEEGGGKGILQVPRSVVASVLRAWPGPLRWGVAAFFAALVAACFLAPATAAGEAALLLVWGVWWPALALSFLLLGRVWCSLCPMAFAGGFAQRLAGGTRQVPGWIKDREPWILAGGFLLILWIEEVTDMRNSPVATGFLLLAILAGAVATALRFPRRTWCRHLCPLGGLAGACSTTSMLEVRSTPDICGAKCTGHACYRGGDGAPGCPMFHHVMFLDTNRDCVLCLDCVRSCPNGSPRVLLRLPAEELWKDLRPRPEVGWLAAVLAGLLPALALVRIAERVPAEPLTGWLEEHRFATLTALLAGMTAIPVLLLARRLRAARGAGEADRRALVYTRLAPWLPLAAAGFTAWQAAFLPGIAGIDTRIGWNTGEGPGETVLSSGVLPVLQGAILVGGLLISLVIRMRQHPRGGEGGEKGALGDTALGMAGAALWFVVVTGLLLGATTRAAPGPWALAVPAAAVAVSFRLTLGFRWR